MQPKPLKHLINILKTTKEHHPNFTLFLGAGASITSGIKSAREMIEEWKASYIEMYGEEKLHEESWYKRGNEYSELFEMLYDQPTQRREYIEKCINDSRPSWGYVYLVNLIKEKSFNTVFTTNFDDLINEACYTFSNNLRPVVCAHDSSIKNIRLTSNRPKIIKLHGDFLFDDIKNTIRELESLEDNMRTKFKQYANEFGMIVMGYAGNDRSIMDTLNTLLHSDNTFPHGIYWCIRKNTVLEDLPEELKNLARFSRFHLVEIDGFDEAMAEIHHSLGLNLQEEVSDPYSALSKRLDKYFSGLEDDEVKSELIKKDMALLSEHVVNINSAKEFINKIKSKINEQDIDLDSKEAQAALTMMLKETEFLKDGKELHIYSMPNVLLANSALRVGDYEKAKAFSGKSLELKFNIESLIIYLNSILKLSSNSTNRSEFESDFLKKVSLLKGLHGIDFKDGIKLISLVVELIESTEFKLADRILHLMSECTLPNKLKQFIILNKSLIIKLQNNELPSDLEAQIGDAIVKCINIEDYWLAFGFAILLGADDLALRAANSLDETQLMSAVYREMPIFNLMSQDLSEKLAELAELKGYLEPAEEENPEPENASSNGHVSHIAAIGQDKKASPSADGTDVP